MDPYLPPQPDSRNSHDTTVPSSSRPFTTLTFATSLDSALSLAPGVRTVLSGPHSKAMTHYLRFRHEAILIGVGTANADDPGLNCRIEGAGGYTEVAVHETERIDGAASTHNTNVINPKQKSPDPAIQTLEDEAALSSSSPQSSEEVERIQKQQETLHQPRPIVVDPKARWALHEHSKIIELVKQGKGKAPFVLISKTTAAPQQTRAILEKYGGKYIALDTVVENDQHFDWNAILNVLYTQEKITSLMIEGGGSIINSLLSEQRYSALIDSVIVTIAPTWLGQGGVVVSPNRRLDENGCAIPASRLTDVKWYPFGEDVVLCGRILRS